MSQLLGQALLWVGFLSGALATVWRIEIESDNPTEVWNTIPWTWYTVSAVVCAAGAVTLRVVRRYARGSSEKSVAEFAQLRSSLARVIKNMGRIKAHMDEWSPSQITSQIDETLADDLRLFGDGRESIVAEHGLQTFADVMAKFAAGERAINRTWSAAADGYLDEAATCIERALILMDEAAWELNNTGATGKAS